MKGGTDAASEDKPMTRKPFQLGGVFRSYQNAADFLRDAADPDYRVQSCRSQGGPPNFRVLLRPGRG
jgi:hypothetical protein